MAQDVAAPAEGIRVILCLKFDDHARFEELNRCKQALIASPEVLHCLEVSGSFHFMAEVSVHDLAAYQTLLDSLTERFGPSLDHYEANFICRRFERQDDSQQHCLWVPCAEGRQRIDCAQIDKVIADGDYVRIASGDNSWLLHSTLTSVAHQLESDDFIQLSRSIVVRTGFIARLIHQGRRWTARLIDGSEYPIAKGRSAGVLASLRAASPKHFPASSTIGTMTEVPLLVAEKTVH